MSASHNISDDDFETEVLKAEGPVMVDFGQSGAVLVRRSHRLLMRWRQSWAKR